jgi:hypothetical protein
MKQHLKTTILLALAAFMVASCRPTSTYFVEPAGPKEYKLGWEDGCDTGTASVSPGIYKAYFGFKKRPEFLDNQLYNTGWNEGFSFCRFSLDQVGRGSPFN